MHTTKTTLTPEQLNSLADERESYGDTREALELRQKAAKIKRQINAEKLQAAAVHTTETLEARMWDSERRSSPYSTVADPSDDSYCEACDSEVVYSGADDRYGRCGCSS